MTDSTIPTEADYARLAEHRAAGWDIDARRDGFALYSALLRSGSSITYICASSIPALVRRLDQITGTEEVPGDIDQAARRAAAGARERAEQEPRDRLDELIEQHQPPEEGEQ